MIRKRLTFALVALAAAVVLEAIVALWALGEARQHVLRGRVASDIQLRFVELSLAKQRLRAWLSQAQFDAKADPAEREQLQAQMRQSFRQLQALSQQAIQLDGDSATRPDHLQRLDALAVLAPSLEQLDRAVAKASPLPAGADAHAAWQAVSQMFEVSQGRNLRSLLEENIARESAAVMRERQGADNALHAMRLIWLGAAATLAIAALMLSAYLARTLRRPLERLSVGAQALQRGELTHRIPAEGNDEFSAVARSVNAMAAELLQHREREARARQQLEELVHARTAELQAAIQTLQQLDVRRRQLFADISHELRTPTTAIRGEAEIALRGRDKSTDEYKTALLRIVETSRQLAVVIDDLLTMARSDIDALSLHREPLDLVQPLTKALAQARVLAHERGITIEAEGLPSGGLLVLGDAQRLQQLLAVLLDNAVRYSRPGCKVEVSVHRIDPDEDASPQCVVRVVDHGIGIAAEDLPRVFERNFRSERARQHRADGTGLGLSIGAALARAHGGEILIDSALGQGTSARLRLPLIDTDQTEGATTL